MVAPWPLCHRHPRSRSVSLAIQFDTARPPENMNIWSNLASGWLSVGYLESFCPWRTAEEFLCYIWFTIIRFCRSSNCRILTSHRFYPRNQLTRERWINCNPMTRQPMAMKLICRNFPSRHQGGSVDTSDRSRDPFSGFILVWQI